MADQLLEWPSGVGGVQCDDCGRSTNCRSFYGHYPDTDEADWLCRPCREGWDDDEYDDPASSDDSLGAASTTLNPPPGENTGGQNA